MKYNSTITSYDRLFYNSGPTKISDYLSDKYNKIHTLLYQDALNKFYKDYPEYENNSNIQIIEIKNKEFWMFPRIYIIDYSKRPFKKIEYSLEPYWNNIYVEKLEDGKIPSELGNSNDQIDYFNYVSGKATMLNRYENEKYKIDFKDLGENLQLSDNLNVYPDTFAYKKIYSSNP